MIPSRIVAHLQFVLRHVRALRVRRREPPVRRTALRRARRRAGHAASLLLLPSQRAPHGVRTQRRDEQRCFLDP